MGLGIVGARRLMDRFAIESAPGAGTTVVLGKALPAGRAVSEPRTWAGSREDLARQAPDDSAGGGAAAEPGAAADAWTSCAAARRSCAQLNRELEDTNRGVVALYAELDEKAESLRRAAEMKSRFLSNMSHEFRTPLNSILALSRLLLDRADGELTPEQEKQVGFIRKAAQDLTELVNDLLDLAKVEAGKDGRPAATSSTSRTCSARLRGMLRPLLATNPAVALVFEDPAEPPMLHTDEGKVSQILRNFISNALKFTERGEVRVRAEPGATTDGRRLRRRRHRHRHRRRRTRSGSSRSSPRSRTRSRSGSRGPAWACRCRASWRSCWGAPSPCAAPRPGLHVPLDVASPS